MRMCLSRMVRQFFPAAAVAATQARARARAHAAAAAAAAPHRRPARHCLQSLLSPALISWTHTVRQVLGCFKVGVDPGSEVDQGWG